MSRKFLAQTERNKKRVCNALEVPSLQIYSRDGTLEEPLPFLTQARQGIPQTILLRTSGHVRFAPLSDLSTSYTREQLDFGTVLRNENYHHHHVVAKTPPIHFLFARAGKLFRASAPALLLCAIPIQAQEQSPERPPAPTVAPGDAQASPKDSPRIAPTAAAKNNHLFFVWPNYLTVENREQFEPLAAKIKFKLSAKTMSDPITISFIGMIALMGQARNSNPSYGQGLSGYAKRYGTFYADTGIGTLMTTSVFPTLLHQDPRYFQLGSGGICHRAMYSVSRILVTRADNGDLQFNSSEIVGNAIAAGLSNTYHPPNQRTLGDTLGVWGTDIMLNAVFNVAKEFWPDVRRKLHRPKS